MKNILNLNEIEKKIKEKHFYLNKKIIFMERNFFKFLKMRKKIILPEIFFRMSGYIFEKHGKYYFSENLPYLFYTTKVYRADIHIQSLFDVREITTYVKTEIKVKDIMIVKAKGYFIFLYLFMFTKRKIWLLKFSEQQKLQLLQAIAY